MTDCTGTLTDRCLERYIQGTLPEHEAQEFEEHYFDCPACLAHVEALQAVAHQLGSQPRKAPPKKVIPWPVRAGALGAIAAVLLIGYLNFHVKRPISQPAIATVPVTPVPHPAPPSLAASAVARLADLTLPAFQAPNLRGQSGNPHFDAGMKAYSRNDCPAAIKALSQVPPQDDDARAAKFYSGVCQMHEGDLNAASRALEAVANAGDSPQQEAALYYLAQVALERNDSTTARHYLARTISLRGDFEKRAQSQLIQVR
jgi:TolA-binding protein